MKLRTLIATMNDDERVTVCHAGDDRTCDVEDLIDTIPDAWLDYQIEHVRYSIVYHSIWIEITPE